MRMCAKWVLYIELELDEGDDESWERVREARRDWEMARRDLSAGAWVAKEV